MTLLDESLPFRAKSAKVALNSLGYVLRRLFQKGKLAKVFVERLTEPCSQSAR
jgi:hypothetical protein